MKRPASMWLIRTTALLGLIAVAIQILLGIHIALAMMDTRNFTPMAWVFFASLLGYPLIMLILWIGLWRRAAWVLSAGPVLLLVYLLILGVAGLTALALLNDWLPSNWHDMFIPPESPIDFDHYNIVDLRYLAINAALGACALSVEIGLLPCLLFAVILLTPACRRHLRAAPDAA